MITLGIIVGNRGFFPASLCDSGRKEILATLEKLGIGVVILPVDATKYGAVESHVDAQKCADLFKANADKIDGLLVTLPNFGDERGVANAIRWSGLRVPVLVHAFNDDPKTMSILHRRDSFCGKMSVCNNLRQYNIPFTLTRLHTVNPDHKSFQQDLADFIVTCRTTKALKNLRIGALGGERPVVTGLPSSVTEVMPTEVPSRGGVEKPFTTLFSVTERSVTVPRNCVTVSLPLVSA